MSQKKRPRIGRQSLKASAFTLFVLLLSGFGGCRSLAQSSPPRPIVLEGTVVTPTEVIRDGMVIIEGERIKAVGQGVAIPEGAVRIATNGLIFPGLIDLHNHITWNVFPRWKDLPRRFRNRYEWRNDAVYLRTYAAWNQALSHLNCERNTYGEVKALLGGVTTVQGSYLKRACVSGLVRNLDVASGLYGETESERLYHVLDIDRLTIDEARNLNDRLAKGELTSLLFHLAEGVPDDPESRRDLQLLRRRGLLGPATGIIHGTAFHPDDFETLRNAGANLIWSPRSNLFLYGTTTNVAEALKRNLLVALSPDWSITGSDTMLDELKAARAYNNSQVPRIWSDDRELVVMVTVNPAEIAGVSDKIGRIRSGYFADLLVIRGRPDDPYRALVDARPQDVELVMIGGQPYYGKASLMTHLGHRDDSEEIAVCGTAGRVRLMVGQTGSPLRQLTAKLVTAMPVVDGHRLEPAPLVSCD